MDPLSYSHNKPTFHSAVTSPHLVSLYLASPYLVSPYLISPYIVSPHILTLLPIHHAIRSKCTLAYPAMLGLYSLLSPSTKIFLFFYTTNISKMQARRLGLVSTLSSPTIILTMLWALRSSSSIYIYVGFARHASRRPYSDSVSWSSTSGLVDTTGSLPWSAPLPHARECFVQWLGLEPWESMGHKPQS